MPGTAITLVALGVAAGIDWWAVAVTRRSVERVAKPATTLALVALAAVAGDAAGDVRIALVAGAALGLVGDVALLDDGDTAFLVGLSAFALGHLAYALAASLVGFDPIAALPGAVVMVVLLAARFASRTVPGAHRHGGPALAAAVVFYALVISAMVVTAWGSGSVVAGIGAGLFALSDWVLGHRRFVGPLPGGELAVIVPYHVGQTLLVVGLATA